MALSKFKIIKRKNQIAYWKVETHAVEQLDTCAPNAKASYSQYLPKVGIIFKIVSKKLQVFITKTVTFSDYLQALLMNPYK